MAATKPDKVREETYDFIVECLKDRSREPVGRSKEGLVYESHLDGEHIVVKVIKKKSSIPEEEIEPVTTYKEKIALYEEQKENKKKEMEN